MFGNYFIKETRALIELAWAWWMKLIRIYSRYLLSGIMVVYSGINSSLIGTF